LPAPDGGLRRASAPHDLKGAMTIRLRQHDLGPPDKLSRSVAVADKGLKRSTVGGAKVKADVIASHAPNMSHHVADGNHLSGGKHWFLFTRAFGVCGAQLIFDDIDTIEAQPLPFCPSPFKNHPHRARGPQAYAC